MRGLLTILFLLAASISFGQGFAYTYVDPCTKKLNTITIPAGQSTVTFSYLGQARTFTKTELEDGTFNMWLYSVQQSSSEPCGEFKGEIQKTQNIIITSNILSTLTSVTSVSTMTVTSTISGVSSQSAETALGNSVNNSSESSSGDNKSPNKGKNGGKINKSKNTKDNPTNGNGEQSGGNEGTTSNSNSGTSQEGGNNTNTNQPTQTGNQSNESPVTNPTSQGSNNNQSGSGGNGGEIKTEEPKTSQTEDKSGGNGGTTNSVANAAESSGGDGNGGKGGSKIRVGSIIGTGDVVAIRSNEDGSNQFRATMSVTKSNTDNTKAKGALLNFTTAINNSNLTFYGAFTNKDKSNTLIFANSSMVNFNYDFFNTTTVLESHRWNKFSLMGGVNFTIGTLADETFTNFSAVGGGFYLFNVGKKVTGNMLILAVYSPFTKFYEGTWWESGTLIVPFSSWDYTLSKNFKFNMSFSGTWEVNKSVLQYQILTGGKILL